MDKKTIVITGSTRGIGYGLAKEFLNYGHQIIINGRIDHRVERALINLQKENNNVIGVIGDVTEKETHEQLIEKAVSTFGKIDIWINNAGIPQPYRHIHEIGSYNLKDIVDINIYGTILGTQYAINHMIGQGHGKIFNMGGFGSDGRSLEKLTVYGTTKKAVYYFTKAISNEIKNTNIQIGRINPGMVKTDFIDFSMESFSSEELLKFKKVFDILAENVDVVTRTLVRKILNSTKNNENIKYMSKIRVMLKMMKIWR